MMKKFKVPPHDASHDKIGNAGLVQLDALLVSGDGDAEKCSGTKCNGYRGKQFQTKSGRTCQNWDA